MKTEDILVLGGAAVATLWLLGKLGVNTAKAAAEAGTAAGQALGSAVGGAVVGTAQGAYDTGNTAGQAIGQSLRDQIAQAVGFANPDQVYTSGQNAVAAYNQNQTAAQNLLQAAAMAVAPAGAITVPAMQAAYGVGASFANMLSSGSKAQVSYGAANVPAAFQPFGGRPQPVVRTQPIAPTPYGGYGTGASFAALPTPTIIKGDKYTLVH